MSLEENEKKRFKDYVVLNVRSVKNPRMSILFEEEGINRVEFRHGYSIVSSSLINACNLNRGCESMSLSCRHFILSKRLNFVMEPCVLE